ncbi:GNAT family N-acetyltransferase [Vulgatibacter incomptus]|uniref:N-acetyltransferase domain-containing protein n=1 Tax=Vulgatibacter incomptus TaxID=1391653 RepID=A0A0K1PBL1_9BACT|nr:GNAT family N-acetyltransferase [Vulgatibacter incomptus]AKU90791.1 hypothetical protein AKJ08_1178 [Vulgatibacter incomptus]
MSIPSIEDAALLENNLVFNEWHRGSVERDPAAIRIGSHIPGFTCVIPLDASGRLDETLGGFDRARLVPWSDVREEDLRERGFAPAGALCFMVLDEERIDRPGAIEIEVVHDADAMKRFTEVQVDGFGASAEEAPKWKAWLGEANLRNLGHASQIFYVGHLAGEPAGVTLLVQTGIVGGIYAVATLPRHRRHGVSRALLQRAIQDARARGCETITLQVFEGSAAYGLYRSLGFRDAFRSPVFAR